MWKKARLFLAFNTPASRLGTTHASLEHEICRKRSDSRIVKIGGDLVNVGISEHWRRRVSHEGKQIPNAQSGPIEAVDIGENVTSCGRIGPLDDRTLITG